MSDLLGIGSVAQAGSGLAVGLLNFRQQAKQFEYQKELNKLQMAREDTQYQRTVNDMRQAGMSPLAMQGLNSSTPLTSASAPQFNPQSLPDILSIAGQVSQIRNANKLAEEDVRAKKLDNLFKSMDMQNQFDMSKAKVISMLYDNMDKRSRAVYNATYGLNSGMSPNERYMQILAHEVFSKYKEGSGKDFRQLEKNPDLFSKFENYGSPVSLNAFQDFVKNIQSSPSSDNKTDGFTLEGSLPEFNHDEEVKGLKEEAKKKFKKLKNVWDLIFN